MCGIIGLLIKKPEWRDRLGELMVPMLIGMTERGPDSAGMAVFGEPMAASRRKLNLYAESPKFDWKQLEGAASATFADVQVIIKANHAVLASDSPPDAMKAWLHTTYPEVHVLSTGRAIDLYKDGWGRISKPKQMSNEFAAGSTYVTVGNRLANLLAGAGRVKEADAIRKAVAQVIGKEKDK